MFYPQMQNIAFAGKVLLPELMILGFFKRTRMSSGMGDGG